MKLYLFLLNDLLTRLGWRFPVLVAWTALVGIGESVSIALLLPLLGMVGVATAGTQGSAAQLIDKGLAFFGLTGPFEILSVIIFVALIQTALAVVLNLWTARLARRYQGRRQMELFRAFMRAKWSFITGKKAGEMTNVIITECERVGSAFTLCLTLLGSFVVTVIYITLSLFIAWQVTLSLIGLAAASALTMTRLYKKSFAVGRSLAPLNAEFQSTLDEQFGGIKFIKASAGEDRAATRIEPLVHKLERVIAFASSLPGTVRCVLEFIALAGLAITLVFASKGMGLAPGNVVVVLALFGRLFPRMTAMQAQLHYLNGNLHAIEAITQLQTAAAAEAERQDHSTQALQTALPSNLVVRNLQVKYDGRLILDQINLVLPIPGMVAIVGKSGAGKSTLVHALLGLADPSAGSIHLGDHEIASAPLHAWRRTIGYVPQETVLFHASIRENLTFVNPRASDAEIKSAARRAFADGFIDALPEGYDTVIGDNGVKLSGGQRQRLGIARALLMNPVLLLLDEAMSALDAESEAEIIETMEELRKHMGILVVSHRLAAVRHADSICVVEQGRVVETGTWDELMERKSRLFALNEAQSHSLNEDETV